MEIIVRQYRPTLIGIDTTSAGIDEDEWMFFLFGPEGGAVYRDLGDGEARQVCDGLKPLGETLTATPDTFLSVMVDAVRCSRWGRCGIRVRVGEPPAS